MTPIDAFLVGLYGVLGISAGFAVIFFGLIFCWLGVMGVSWLLS